MMAVDMPRSRLHGEGGLTVYFLAEQCSLQAAEFNLAFVL